MAISSLACDDPVGCRCMTWANFATLDEVSIATGEVVPAGRIKVVQHLEGGIIQEIYVSEGDTVREKAKP